MRQRFEYARILRKAQIMVVESLRRRIQKLEGESNKHKFNIETNTDVIRVLVQTIEEFERRLEEWEREGYGDV